MAEDLVVAFVGKEADARALAALLSDQPLATPPVMTRVSAWRTFTALTTGWDVIVAGGPLAPAQPDEIQRNLPDGFLTPVMAVVQDPYSAPVDRRIRWFGPHEMDRMALLLRSLRRTAVAEHRRRQLQDRVDILERQLRQTGRLRALGQMSAGVAHEFNNLLTVIGGYSERLIPRVIGSDLERLVRPIQQAGARGAELSQRLLTFSREPAPTVGDVSVTAALHEAGLMLMPLLGETISLRLHLDHSAPRVRGQAGPLIEVITNLAVNARDAMPAGGILTIETKQIAADDSSEDSLGRVALVVRDTGAGMDAETLVRACEPFFTTKGHGTGTGLGLSLVRDIVEQCGGTLSIASVVGTGTEVTVLLPAVRPDDAAVPELPEPELTSSGGFETVLLVEDDAAVREIVTEFLRGAAYYVLEARDGHEAVAIVRRDPKSVDLLVTDIVLPGQSGPELAGALRQYAPQMRTLFISGYPSDASGKTRSPAFLAKPFSRAALLQAVRRALGAKRHRESDAADVRDRLEHREPDNAQGPRDGSH